ncbi:MAG TPA: alpha/beta hydrolase, partial [Aggregatilineales bacterium]|nr:alpha/beta hydrolase [Aggregatilineales bacterium]
QVQDLARAFAWIAENIADYGGDPNKIVVGGHSAGGQLIALLATDAQYVEATGHNLDEIKGVIPISGVLVLSSENEDVFPAGSLQDFSPINYVLPDSDLPPFLILLADRDEQHIILAAQLMQAALRETDASFNIVVIPGRDHFSIMHFVGQGDDLVTRLITSWFAKIFEDNAS